METHISNICNIVSCNIGLKPKVALIPRSVLGKVVMEGKNQGNLIPPTDVSV